MNENDMNQQLNKSIQALTNALAASERRIHSMERLFRHLGIIVLILAAVVLLPKAGTLFGTAQASITDIVPGLKLADKDLAHISSILANLDSALITTVQINNNPAVGQGISDLFVLMTRLKQDSDVLRTGLVQSSMTPEKFQALQKDPVAFQNAVNQASPVNLLFSLMQDKTLTQGVSDLLTLSTRIKQDSDVLRQGLLKSSMNPMAYEQLKSNKDKFNQAIIDTSPTQILYSIQNGIKDEIHFLNGNIQSMVYSIDSTMGRVGRMMSPMPTPPFGF